MSLEKIRDSLENFIKNDDNDLIVVKGDWGIGKTYFWKKLISDVAGKNNIGKNYYAYVSLFGVNNLSDLKNAILTSYQKTKNINDDSDIGSLIKRASSVFQNLEDIPKIGEWSNIATYAAFQFVKGGLICFDDLERKGNELGFKELFGLATALKETKNCKIVFILNEEYLERNRDEFKTHSEKLIDFEIKFDRSAENAFKCAFSTDHKFYNILKKHCLNLNICNIRILQRIKRYVEPLINTLENSEEETTYQVLHSLVLFCWLNYAKGKHVPSIKFIEEQNESFFSIARDEDLNENEVLWKETLNNYNFTYLSDLDEEILDYVQQGYFDEKNLKDLLESKNFEIKKKTARQNYEKAWDIYSNSFDDNAEEFVVGLTESFEENIDFLSPKKLNSVLDILRKLNFQDKADELIEKYFETHKKLERFSLTLSPYQGHITDDELKRRLKQNEQKNKSPKKLGAVIKKITNSSSYNQEDIRTLTNSSLVDYYNFFKSEKSEMLVNYIRRCLQFGKMATPSPSDKKIYEKTVKALKKVAAEHNFNEMRVKNIYGITLDDSD